MQAFKRSQRLRVKLHSPRQSIEKLTHAKAEYYKLAGVLVCRSLPKDYERSFTLLKTYLLLIMKRTHPNFNPNVRSKFVVFDQRESQGIAMSANEILNHFKPIVDGKEEFEWGK